MLVPKSTLLLRERICSLTEITEPMRHDFGENFSSMCHEWNTSVVTTLGPILLFVQHFDNNIPPFLRHLTRYPYPRDDAVVGVLQYFRRLSVQSKLQEFCR